MKKLAYFLLAFFSCVTGKAIEFSSSQKTSDVKTQNQEAYITNKILLQALNKVTGRVITLEAEINKAISFDTLQIVARFCKKSAPEDPPESTAFLEILEKTPDAPEKILFQGWMFASYPAISALEHPVYDVWVKSCNGSVIDSTKSFSSFSNN